MSYFVRRPSGGLGRTGTNAKELRILAATNNWLNTRLGYVSRLITASSIVRYSLKFHIASGICQLCPRKSHRHPKMTPARLVIIETQGSTNMNNIPSAS
jgi:hypothetical protein